MITIANLGTVTTASAKMPIIPTIVTTRSENVDTAKTTTIASRATTVTKENASGSITSISASTKRRIVGSAMRTMSVIADIVTIISV